MTVITDLGAEIETAIADVAAKLDAFKTDILKWKFVQTVIILIVTIVEIHWKL